MKIKQHSIVTMHYSIKDDKEKLLETTFGSAPMQFMVGLGFFLPPVEERLIGLEPGDKTSILIHPDEGYGKKDKNLQIKIAASDLPDGNIKVGNTFWRGSANGERKLFTVTGLLGKWIFLDGNHPWAGIKLYYEFEILRVNSNTYYGMQKLK